MCLLYIGLSKLPPKVHGNEASPWSFHDTEFIENLNNEMSSMAVELNQVDKAAYVRLGIGTEHACRKRLTSQ